MKTIKTKLQKIDEIKQTVNSINLKVSYLESKMKTMDTRINETEKSCQISASESEANKKYIRSAKADIKHLKKSRSKAVLLLWIFYVFVLSCVCYVLCASVYMCFVVTCWERADLLALVCGVFCEFVTFPLVSWVRCGTWLYRFLIFATLLTVTHSIKFPRSWVRRVLRLTKTVWPWI